jgi:ribosomal protein S12 methylthiotransferase
VKDFRFSRLGVFTYSHEDGTNAASLPDKIPQKEKLLRQKTILEIQKQISLEDNNRLIGNELKVIIDRSENGRYVGRSYLDAPEIDQEIFVDGKDLVIGEFRMARIYDAEEFDVFAIATD